MKKLGRLLAFLSSLMAAPLSLAAVMDDLNGNGFSDIWEVAYGLEDPSSGADADGDGDSDATEARHGTDPYDPESRFRLEVLAPPRPARLLQWAGAPGRRYQAQGFTPAGQWENLGEPVTCLGPPLSLALVPASVPHRLYRLMLLSGMDLPAEAGRMLAARDTDGDGQSDWLEWLAGSSLIDPQERFLQTLTGLLPTVSLRWRTLPGIDYYLERHEGGSWHVIDGPYSGDGGESTVAMPRTDGAAIYRLRSVAADSDGDGLLDWEEHLAGLEPLDPNSGHPHQPDREFARDNLLRGGAIELTSIRPLIRMRMETEGLVRLRRSGGLAPLRVALQVDDSPYLEVHPREISLGLGEMEVDIRVSLKPGIKAVPDSAVTLTVRPSVDYELGPRHSRSVTLLTPRLYDVTAFGAVGDGVTDDTAAIQTAIAALEQSPASNGLFFPAGKYRIATVRYDAQSPLGNRRMLKLGGTGLLDGRDILLHGEPGACLYADAGSVRANLLVAIAEFRSLSIEGMCFEKSSVPLPPVPGYEPNGADGLTVVANERQAIEGILVRNSSFINCHRAISIYGAGYDIRGGGGCFHLQDCTVLNPYGANTIDSQSAWGGGQQIYLAAWVADAIYENCFFDGGGPDLTDPDTSPGGRVKDGCHFGSPLRLSFRNNEVYRMGVEAIHQTNETTLMGVTREPFVMPEPDGVTTVAVTVTQWPSSWLIGNIVNIRTPGTPGVTPKNNHMIIRGYDHAAAVAMFMNSGYQGNSPPGTEFPKDRVIYLDDRAEPSRAIVEGNLLNGTMPPGGLAANEQAGIVVQARSIIKNNLITGFGGGIISRDEVHTPRHPASRGITLRDNVILTRHAPTYPNTYTYGIEIRDGFEMILSNLILCPVSWKTVGIAVRGGKSQVSGNTVTAETILVNGYTSPQRSTGIGNGNGAYDLRAWNNSTRGFDVGLGPLGAYMATRFIEKNHKSIDDDLPIDPRGRQPW